MSIFTKEWLYGGPKIFGLWTPRALFIKIVFDGIAFHSGDLIPLFSVLSPVFFMF